MVCEDDVATSKHLLCAGELGVVLDRVTRDCPRSWIGNYSPAVPLCSLEINSF